MKVTIQQVADELGVSVCTVSRILNGRDQDYRQETRRKVLEGVRRLGYRVNQSARAMRRGRFGCVTLLSSDVIVRSVMGFGLLAEIGAALARRDNHLSLAQLSDDQLNDETFIYDFLRRWYSDGLLININCLVPAALEECLTKNGIPCVWLNRKLSQNAVRPDDVAVGAAAIEHLLQRRRRQLIYFNAAGDLHYSATDRLSGAMTRAGRDGLEILNRTRPCGPLEKLDYAREVLAGVTGPAGIFAYSCECAWSVFRAAMLEGLRVPEDIGIITVAEETPRREDITLSHVLLPTAEMGRAAVEMLLARIDQPKRDRDSIAIRGFIKEGNTT